MEPFYSYSFSTTHSSKIADQNLELKGLFSLLNCLVVFICVLFRVLACFALLRLIRYLSKRARAGRVRVRILTSNFPRL